MNNQDQLTYYRQQCVHLMSVIEDRTGKMIHESQHSKLEYEFWLAVDAKDLNKVKLVHNLLCKITDNINEL